METLHGDRTFGRDTEPEVVVPRVKVAMRMGCSDHFCRREAQLLDGDDVRIHLRNHGSERYRIGLIDQQIRRHDAK